MPAKNSRKEFRENTFYHIYNRGVEKRSIFVDEMDYAVFMSYLTNYLLPKDEDFLRDQLSNLASTPKQKSEALRLLKLNNFHDSISLITYFLITKHFHLLVKQIPTWGIDSFMNSLMTRYTMYFNRKYKRVGHLFQGNYKAVSVETEEQLLHLTRYIHQNPNSKGVAFQSYPPSSYLDFIANKPHDWIRAEIVLSYFSKRKGSSYPEFVGDINTYDSYPYIKGLTLTESD